jgi:hypothetical protein
MGCPSTEIRSFHLRTETYSVSKMMCSFKILKDGEGPQTQQSQGNPWSSMLEVVQVC